MGWVEVDDRNEVFEASAEGGEGDRAMARGGGKGEQWC